MNTHPTTPDDSDELPPAMQTTAQLQNNHGKFTAFAATLIAKAERIDVQRDFAAEVQTKFRKPRTQLVERSRLLRQQAGEVFSRIDKINAELEFREIHTRESRVLVCNTLSAESRAAIAEIQISKEPATLYHRDQVKSVMPANQHRVAPGKGFQWKANSLGSGAWVAIA
jgi:hypothetical protein